jgi:hypothetical protein
MNDDVISKLASESQELPIVAMYTLIDQHDNHRTRQRRDRIHDRMFEINDKIINMGFSFG